MIDDKLTRDLLRQLVTIDSVNPTLVPGARGEGEIARFLAEFLRHHGIAAQLEEAAPGRPNVVARIGPGESPRARESAPDNAAASAGKSHATLAILAHMDTVGAGDMANPFTPRECDGHLYGRGALDIKSGVAAMCAAAVALAREGARLSRPLLIAAVVDEECNSIGTETLVKKYSADAAVVLEPTDLRLCVAHKGYAWFEIVTHGRAAHGSLPAEGRDAIRMMGRALNLLDALDHKLATHAPHPLLGHGSVHASLISGGQELSSYPAQCRLEIERRTLPGESAEQTEAELRGLVAGLESQDSNFRATVRRLAFRPAYEIPRSAPLVKSASEVMGHVTGSVELSGMSAWTDTALLAAAGIPGAVLGPRGRGLHGAEEYVELDSVFACGEILYQLIRDLCG